MTAITELEARDILHNEGRPECSARRYAAQRIEDGWRFSWRPERGAAPLGARGRVVTDDGSIRKPTKHDTRPVS